MRRLLGVVGDSAPVVVLALIAAAGSFTHIRDTATEHGQRGWMAWAIAVCIDLTCVMAAGERQRDKRTCRDTGRLTWPTLVLVGGILLSLAANLAQADASIWGWITAGTPAGAFLVAVSMLERRTAGPRSAVSDPAAPAPASAPDSGQPSSSQSPSQSSSSSPSSSSPWVVWEQDRPEVTVPVLPVPDEQPDERQDERANEQIEIAVPLVEESAGDMPGPASPLVAFARRVADDHHTKYGRPITRDALRSRLGVSNQLASDLLHQVRTTDPAPAPEHVSA
ncbi:DUF2637 domain-containing protein [Actinomadura xylanilytica]|uniref:DUF2637 domain-containing protein n=1 Tax=Actinomadura xylanilytica TaxID=887459 RepID=UPI00255B328B|nr:DUF2637 domain-containing protein [Actinomadura xylanilytica]MDL4776355.1 DUF2637 domain-containing protein [Actinomadura xylanilytica]